MSTGLLIRRAREADGLTQAQLARRLGITQPSVARIEGAGDEVSVATLKRALSAMGRGLELRAVKQAPSYDESLLRQNLELGWNHHIQRLMVLGNFMLIAGINPQEALCWFSEMYVDAYDWVMAANVLGMSLYADGGYMATKPYAATSTYIRRMSNYCAGCRFDPDQKTGPEACPFNYLYWDFIGRHAERFGENMRMRAIVGGWLKRTDASREAVHQSAAAFLQAEVPV